MKKPLRKLLLWIYPELKDIPIKENIVSKWHDIINDNVDILKHCERIIQRNDALIEINKSLLDKTEVSVDVHNKSDSWAVISLEGEKKTYIKFIDLSDKDIEEIAEFLSHFDRRKIDATPRVKKWIETKINTL